MIVTSIYVIVSAIAILFSSGTLASAQTETSELEARCAAGDGKSCHSLGMDHLNSKEAEEVPKAISFMAKACDLNFADSCTLLGTIIVSGNKDEASILQAVELFEKGCKLGDASGCQSLVKLSSVLPTKQETGVLDRACFNYKVPTACTAQIVKLMDREDFNPQDRNFGKLAKTGCGLGESALCHLYGMNLGSDLKFQKSPAFQCVAKSWRLIAFAGNDPKWILSFGSNKDLRDLETHYPIQRAFDIVTLQLARLSASIFDVSIFDAEDERHRRLFLGLLQGVRLHEQETRKNDFDSLGPNPTRTSAREVLFGDGPYNYKGSCWKGIFNPTLSQGQPPMSTTTTEKWRAQKKLVAIYKVDPMAHFGWLE